MKHHLAGPTPPAACAAASLRSGGCSAGTAKASSAASAAANGASDQGLTLVHFWAQRELILWDTLGASFPPSLLDRGTRGGVTKTAQVELKSGRV